ncbi:MAG TPA: hypothetical protein VKB05_11350 [Pyrinomonadaceae bacterium]|nr:hypothetical protein [Pyrinomonadaceae bacterium]
MLAIILISVALSTAQSLDRIYRIFHDVNVNHEESCESCLNLASQSDVLPIEVFQVLDLPLNVHEASLTKSERGFYFLKLSLGNNSDLKILGLRYSLVSIDARNQVQIRVNRTEGFSLPAYDMKTLTFKTPIKLKQKDGERLLLMIEQVISHESIWEVVKAKDALEAYARGDYSIVPSVLRVSNQVDSPPAGRPIRYERH